MDFIIDRLFIFVLGFFEAIAINYFFATISQYKILSIKKLIIFASSLGVVASVTDYFEVPYHLVISIVTLVVIFHLVSKYKFIDSSIDILFSFVLFVMIQAIITFIAISIYNNILENNYLLLLLLIIIIVISIIIYKSKILDGFFKKYYQPNKNLIFIVVVNMYFLLTIIIKMYYFDSESTGSMNDIELIFIGYVIANLLIIIVAFIYFNEKHRRQMIMDYGKSLETIVNELKSMSHEHNSHLQILLSILNDEDKSNEERIKGAKEYFNILAKNTNNSQTVSFVKDNILISAVLHHATMLAIQLDIKLDIVIESSLSKYEISDNDIVDILTNLINNAFEEVYLLSKEERRVGIIFSDNLIEISNRIQKKKANIDSNKFVEQGYSTKGLGRGYGISNVLSILEKYDYKFENEINGNMYISKIVVK